jgi:hypothetical protein
VSTLLLHILSPLETFTQTTSHIHSVITQTQCSHKHRRQPAGQQAGQGPSLLLRSQAHDSKSVTPDTSLTRTQAAAYVSAG